MRRHKPGFCATLALAILGLAACDAGSDAPPLDFARDSIGDTITVRAVAATLPTRGLRVREELRIGVLDGTGPDAFGSITAIAGLPDGSVVAFDEQVPALRHFGPDGDYLKTFAGAGEGPGEYSSRVRGLIVDPQGRVVLRDAADGRVLFFGQDGSFQSDFLIPGGGFYSAEAPILVDAEGRFHLRTVLTNLFELDDDAPWPLGFTVHDADGEIPDTIPKPTHSNGESASFWEPHPAGGHVLASNDRYFVEIQRSGGRVVRIQIETDPVAYSAAEHDWLRPLYRRANEADGEFGEPELPEFKPILAGMKLDRDGRIWVKRLIALPAGVTAALNPRSEPAVFDIFDIDGAYLGTVRPPESASIQDISGAWAWSIEPGHLDEPYVVRYGIEGLG